jgi:RNA polymerase sigma-70 factor (ECF subfamily)
MTMELRGLNNLDDVDAWRKFFDKYWSLIYSAAAKSGLNDADAQDIVQETMLSVAHTIGNINTGPQSESF